MTDEEQQPKKESRKEPQVMESALDTFEKAEPIPKKIKTLEKWSVMAEPEEPAPKKEEPEPEVMEDALETFMEAKNKKKRK